MGNIWIETNKAWESATSSIRLIDDLLVVNPFEELAGDGDTGRAAPFVQLV